MTDVPLEVVSYHRSHPSSHPRQKVIDLNINLPNEKFTPGIAKALDSDSHDFHSARALVFINITNNRFVL